MPYPQITVGGQVYFYDDFLGAALEGAVAGTSENSGTAAIVVAQPGGVAGLVTGTTSGNRSQLTTGLNHLVSDGSIIVQWRAKPVGAVADEQFFFGLTDTVSLEMPIEVATTTITTNASNAAGFYYGTAATTPAWRFGAVNGDADKGSLASIVYKNGSATVAAPADGVYEIFQVEITPDGDAVFSYGQEINEVLQGMQEVGRLENAVATTALLTPIAITETLTTAASTVYVDYLLIQSGREDGY